MFLFKKKEHRIWPFFLLAFFVLLTIAGVWTYRWAKSLTISDIIGSSFARNYISTNADEKEKQLFDLLPELMGLTAPKNYLVLFLNNTELRPGGGFIGSYAVVNVNQGAVNILKVEGTETLDRNTPANWKPTAPKPITEHLGVDRWYFRDSNWSPDFAESAKKALEFYVGEQGEMSGKIDMIIGFTPQVLEEMLKIIGPVTVEGITFDADNVVEKLEYEVEYGQVEKGVSFHDRKQIMVPLVQEILSKAKKNILTNLNSYEDLITRLVEEKQVMIYSANAGLEDKFIKYDIGGILPPVKIDSDYLLWVDANLAALKTDHAIKRTLSYSLKKDPSGRYLAVASMKYEHLGQFDWRTSRYRTYARVFAPLGSELISVEGAMLTDRSDAPGIIDQGAELGRQWFGTFIAIEPGDTGVLTFTYLLPESISEQIKNGSYTLFVQKQLGTVASGLTLDLNFDKTIRSAVPAEESEEWGDGTYVMQTDLRLDRNFSIALEK